MVTIAFQPALARARAALEHGRHADAVAVLTQALKSSGLKHEDEAGLKCALAEAWLLGDDITQASATLGRPPDTRENLPPALLSALWRLHGRLAFAKGDQSRAISHFGRALQYAQQAHDSEAIGLAHYELGQCYKQVGDTAIVREHIAKAAPALHAAGNRRYLALLHSLSGVVMAMGGRLEEAIAALRQAERLATSVQAADVLGIITSNQANVALIQHRHDQALALAERSTALQEQIGPGRGLAISLANLGQILVRLGQLERAEKVLHKALKVRSPIQFHEITGAVYDSLAQIALVRGTYEAAGDYLRQAGEAYGGYGARTSSWYDWSIRALEAKLAARRGATEEALRLALEISTSAAAPPDEAIQAELIASEALLAGGRAAEAHAGLVRLAGRIDARAMPGAWGEFLRLRGAVHAAAGRLSEAYHDIAQSASVFDLVGDGYQGALSHLALGRLASRAGARSQAEHQFARAAAVFESLGAARDLAETQIAASMLPLIDSTDPVVGSLDADDAVVRRLVDAAAFPELLAHETAAAVRDTMDAECAVVFVAPADGNLRLVAWTGADAERAGSIAARAVGRAHGTGWVVTEQTGRDVDGPRHVAVLCSRPVPDPLHRRLRMIAAIAAQGFELCAARQRPSAPIEIAPEQRLEPLLPGFLCASPAMSRVVEQIQRMQGNELTVLITGESGTGKELVARAIHVGSMRSSGVFLPYNCTTTSRDLADSQLFGHRRGSFTGAVSDQLGLVRTAAGGTLFLDEIGDLPLDVQPKLLRFLEQGEIMPVGETRPLRVNVRVLAATNVDLEQRVAAGRFREDLYYRLTVIRIVVPPLRDRREEIPHLTSLFLREASERLGKPDVFLTPETLELFAQYWWPGNVRQLRNEIQGVVALSLPGRGIGPEHLSPELTSGGFRPQSSQIPIAAPRPAGTSLAEAVDGLEREIIEGALHQSSGNISEAARTLGLTRRGLYLKLRRLGLEAAPIADTK